MPESFDGSETLRLWQTGPGQDGVASELELLKAVDACFPLRAGSVLLGRGHDCAVLAPASPAFCLSTDLFLEDEHFSRRYFRPEEAGAKALAAAVSDLAAAGAMPEAFSLGLILPPDLGRQALSALLRGMAEEAGRAGMALCGGDVTRGNSLGLALTVWGSAADGNAPFLQRRLARPGHIIFIAGQAGLARVGLWALEGMGRAALEQWPLACDAHLRARPLLAEGQALARLLRAEGRAAPPLALMDVSDGLAADLPRLLEPFGANLEAPPDLIPEETRRAAPLMGLKAEDCFLLGGEDYALAGSCPPEFWPKVQASLPRARLLGRVRQAPGLCLNGTEFSGQGFDHFRPSGPAPHPEPRPATALRCAKARRAAAALARIGREAWQAGLMAGFNGNLSCRLTLDSGREACLITRSGAAKARLEESDFCLLDLENGALISGPAPSSESAVHLGIYRACPQSRAVIHVHPPLLLAASLALEPQERLNLPLPEAAAYSSRLAWTPFFPPGSAELGRAVAKAAPGSPALWMEKHGLVVHGPDPAAALALAEELEQLAKIRLALGSAAGPARQAPGPAAGAGQEQ